ncbi:hypothetical protein [Methanosarcina mazei]|nr:hypothetical protein [Methanosarcina mazei]
MLEYTMKLVYWKKWDGENWAKALEGYTSKPQKSALRNCRIKV